MVLRALILALSVGLAGAYSHELRSRAASPHATADFSHIPAGLEGWTSHDDALTENVARTLDADVLLQRLYRDRDGRQVVLFLAYFAQQAVNSQIHSPRHCVPGGGWRIVATDQETVRMTGGPQTAARMFVERNGQRQQLDYWFRTRGGSLSGEYALKWDLLRNALAGRPTDALFVRYSASMDDLPAMHELMDKLAGPLAVVESEVGLR